MSDELITIVKNKFPVKDCWGYKGERQIHEVYTEDNDDTLFIRIRRYNFSSIYYRYDITVLSKIDKDSLQIKISTETSASIGDPYCQKGYHSTPKEYIITKNLSDFKSNTEIVEFINKTFFEYYFRINSRN